VARLTLEQPRQVVRRVQGARRRVARRRRRRVRGHSRRRRDAEDDAAAAGRGFDRPDTGRILIGDNVVSTPERQLPPEERRIGIVFQSYALWPHMTVAENVAYGLTVAGVRTLSGRSA
jgi:hypothetical protein